MRQQEGEAVAGVQLRFPSLVLFPGDLVSGPFLSTAPSLPVSICAQPLPPLVPICPITGCKGERNPGWLRAREEEGTRETEGR